MQIKTILTGQIQENCYLVWDENNIAMLIDPGDDAWKIKEEIKKQNLQVEKIVLTHGHYDHVGAVNAIKEATGAKVLAFQKEKPLIEDDKMSLGFFIGDRYTKPQIDFYITEQDTILCGNIQFQVLHTPGHTEGSMCLYTDGVLFTGDTIFQNSVGRCDFPTGNLQKLLDSIQNRIFKFPKNTVIYSGHGNQTTVGEEMEHNEVYQWLSI